MALAEQRSRTTQRGERVVTRGTGVSYVANGRWRLPILNFVIIEQTMGPLLYGWL